MPMHHRFRGRIALATATILAALVSHGCTSGDASSMAITVRDSSGVAIVTNDLTKLTQACTIAPEPSVSIGVEEGEEPYMIAGLGGAIVLSDGRIVLANRASDQIRYFDAAGKFLASSGRKGEGPGEFREPFHLFALPGDTIYVGDFRPWRFLVFGPDGRWTRTITLDPMEINTPRTRGVLRDGRAVLGFDDEREGGKPNEFPVAMMSLRVYGTDGKVTDSLGRLPNGRLGQQKPNDMNFFVAPFFEAYAQATATGDRIFTGHASKSELTVRGAAEGFPVERIIRWDAGGLEITAADLAAERARLHGVYDKLPDAQRIGLQAIREAETSPDRPVADQFPAFGLLRIGRDGRIWIREYPRPTDASGKHRWIAFDTDGRFDCRLETPRFREYLEFGADYLLIADPDSTTDVERVRRFPITRASGGR